MHARMMPRRRVIAIALAGAFASTSIANADSPLTDVSVDYLTPGTSLESSTDIQQTAYDVAPLQDAAATTGESVVADSAPAVEPMAAEPMPMTYDHPVVMSSTAPCSCCNSTCCSKKDKEAATGAMKGAYKGLFYANDFRYLDDRCYDGPSFLGDSLKGLAGGKLDIGGEARARYHSENGFRGAGLSGNDDEFWLTRLRLFANYRINDTFRIYGEYLYADSAGETLPSLTVEENRGEIQNLFLDTQLTDTLSLRVGRQEILLGNQRLVSPLDWANTRRTFQGARGTYKNDNWEIDGFFLHPVERIAANSSRIDDANEDIDFFGVHGVRRGLPMGTVEAYYFGLENQDVDFSYHTLGTRIYGETDGGILYEAEGGVQFGDNSPGFGEHDAGFITTGLGKKLTLGEWKPTFWMWYDYASGGDDVPAARGDDSFDHLFPLAHKYLGFMDLFGRRNINDVNFQLITPVFGNRVKLLLWYHHFFLDEATTPYNLTLAPFNPGVAAGDRELGQELDILFNVALNPRNSVLFGYSHFNAGDYYETTPGVATDADADFFYMQYQTRF